MTKLAVEISRPKMNGDLMISHVMFLTKGFPAFLKEERTAYKLLASTTVQPTSSKRRVEDSGEAGIPEID